MLIIGIVMFTTPVLDFVMSPFEPHISMHFILPAIFTYLTLYIITEKQTGLILKQMATVFNHMKANQNLESWGRMAKRRKKADILGRPIFLHYRRCGMEL